MAVEVHQRVQRQCLRTRPYLSINRQMGQELHHLIARQRLRVLLVMEQNEALDPVPVSLYGPRAIAPDGHVIEQRLQKWR